jgi:hypothetical protein
VEEQKGSASTAPFEIPYTVSQMMSPNTSSMVFFPEFASTQWYQKQKTEEENLLDQS